MSIFPTDCLTKASIQPNSTILAQIEACQAAANTTYCFPPNGTRICAPAEDIPFFWPTKSYHSDAKVALSWDPSSSLVFLRNNTGNDTQDYTPYMFDYRATSTPGSPYERAMKMSILERRFNNVDEPFNIKTHDGPTVILVKTAEWPRKTSAYSSPTATHGSKDGQSKGSKSDDDENRVKGTIAGIVVGVVGVVLFLSFWCFGPCCLNMKRERRVAGDREAGKTVHSHQIMAETGAGSRGHDDNDEIRRLEEGQRLVEGIGREEADRRGVVEEISRVEADRRSQEGDDMSCHGDPPPRYTP